MIGEPVLLNVARQACCLAASRARRLVLAIELYRTLTVGCADGLLPEARSSEGGRRTLNRLTVKPVILKPCMNI